MRPVSHAVSLEAWHRARALPTYLDHPESLPASHAPAVRDWMRWQEEPDVPRDALRVHAEPVLERYLREADSMLSAGSWHPVLGDFGKAVIRESELLLAARNKDGVNYLRSLRTGSAFLMLMEAKRQFTAGMYKSDPETWASEETKKGSVPLAPRGLYFHTFDPLPMSEWASVPLPVYPLGVATDKVPSLARKRDGRVLHIAEFGPMTGEWHDGVHARQLIGVAPTLARGPSRP
jgi:hypothetical protein